jgi:hypothetical protein
MEILPHFWITYYNENLRIIKEKKIKNIIHLSNTENFIRKNNIEEIKIPINYSEDDSYETINTIMYQYLFDITDYIHQKILNNENILLIGLSTKQDIDVIIIAYYIRYGHLNIQQSLLYLRTKKKDIFYPKCLFYDALNKFYNELNIKY